MSSVVAGRSSSRGGAALAVAISSPLSSSSARVTGVRFFASDKLKRAVTGQVQLDSYADTGVYVAIDLVNELAVASPDDPVAVVRQVLAIDPPSVGQFVPAGARLRGPGRRPPHGVRPGASGPLDSVAALLNHMLATYPSHPHLALEDGVWRLHHPVDAELIPMWTAICAEALARLIGNGHAQRLGTCERPGCGRVFVDVTKNASRAFCSTTCQNRVKAAAFRARRDVPAQAVESSHSSNVGPPSRHPGREQAALVVDLLVRAFGGGDGHDLQPG